MKIGDHVYAMGQAIGVQMDAKYTEDNGLLVGDLISYRREICVGHAPVDVLDIGVEAAVLMHHQHGGQLAFRTRRL